MWYSLPFLQGEGVKGFLFSCSLFRLTSPTGASLLSLQSRGILPSPLGDRAYPPPPSFAEPRGQGGTLFLRTIFRERHQLFLSCSGRRLFFLQDPIHFIFRLEIPFSTAGHEQDVFFRVAKASPTDQTPPPFYAHESFPRSFSVCRDSRSSEVRRSQLLFLFANNQGLTFLSVPTAFPLRPVRSPFPLLHQSRRGNVPHSPLFPQSNQWGAASSRVRGKHLASPLSPSGVLSVPPTCPFLKAPRPSRTPFPRNSVSYSSSVAGSLQCRRLTFPPFQCWRKMKRSFLLLFFS